MHLCNDTALLRKHVYIPHLFFWVIIYNVISDYILDSVLLIDYLEFILIFQYLFLSQTIIMY